jgi:hypothetical protein
VHAPVVLLGGFQHIAQRIEFFEQALVTNLLGRAPKSGLLGSVREARSNARPYRELFLRLPENIAVPPFNDLSEKPRPTP